MLKNIVVLVSGGGTNLQALLDAQARGELGGGRIVGVVSSKEGAYALERAAKASVPGFVVPKKDYPDHRSYSLALLGKCQELKADLIILAGFMHILTSDFIDAYENAILNVHPALIPSFCGEGFYGLHVHEKALEYGVKVTGATVHFVTAEPDGGPVIAQRAVDIREDDTPQTLQRRVMEEAEWQLLPRAAALFCQDRLRVEGRQVHILEEETL